MTDPVASRVELTWGQDHRGTCPFRARFSSASIANSGFCFGERDGFRVFEPFPQVVFEGFFEVFRAFFFGMDGPFRVLAGAALPPNLLFQTLLYPLD